MIGISKLRYALAEHGELLLKVSVLVLLVGLSGSVLTLAFPPMGTVTEHVDESAIESQVGSGAIVEGSHEFYEDGERLTDERVYVRGVTPEVTLTATTQTPTDDVTIDQDLAIVYEATTTDGSVFRDKREVLAASSTGGATGGDVVETTAVLEPEDVETTLASMREEIGDAGEVDAYLAVSISYEADEYHGTLEAREQIVISPESIRVPTLSLFEYGTREISEEPNADRVFQPTLPIFGTFVIPHTTPVFVFTAVIGLVGIVGVRRGAGAVDQQAAQMQIHQQRYDEWISNGTLPEKLGERTTTIAVDSLEDLVDVAIDTGTRVVYDPSQGRYAVVTAGATYIFVQPTD